MDLDALRREVDAWFEPTALEEIVGIRGAAHAHDVAVDWLSRAGKRWRPFLTACVYRAVHEDPSVPLPTALRRIAVAVECFHKASLIHDDIEDGDALRYGKPALHVEYGVPVAVNAGDLLIGEGYRLLAECGAPPEVRVELLRIAAEGHCRLCLGQGAELAWARQPRPLTSAEVADIFRLKTATAFEVALRLGAAFAGAPSEVHGTLSRYSDALGIAYQIRDDVDDLTAGEAPDDLAALRPGLPLAIAYERAKGAEKEPLVRFWSRTATTGDAAEVRRIFEELGIAAQCRGLVDLHKEQAVRSLPELQNASLKGLLRRVVGKIFRVEIKGWCSEFEARNAAGGAGSAAAAR
jgi:geranylgeranyl pyrophosphate synthase